MRLEHAFFSFQPCLFPWHLHRVWCDPQAFDYIDGEGDGMCPREALRDQVGPPVKGGRGWSEGGRAV